MIIVSKIPLDHLDLLHEMRYVYAMKCSTGDKNQIDQCGRAYGFGAHTLGLYMLLCCPWMKPYNVPNINLMDNRKSANIQPKHHFDAIPNWDDFDFSTLNEDEDLLDEIGEANRTANLDLHLTRGLSDGEDITEEDEWEESIRLARPTEWSDDAMSDIQPGTSHQDDTNVEMESSSSSSSSSSDEEMEQPAMVPTDPPDITRYRYRILSQKEIWTQTSNCFSSFSLGTVQNGGCRFTVGSSDLV